MKYLFLFPLLTLSLFTATACDDVGQGDTRADVDDLDVHRADVSERSTDVTPFDAGPPDAPPPLFPDLPEQDAGPGGEALGPPYPIVLVHGFSGWSEAGPVDYFFRVKDTLEDEGHVVVAPSLPPYNASEDRAEILGAVIDEVLRRTNKRKVHVIAHSQGGVDSRRAISALGYDTKVANLITISTPHRGTPLADIALNAPSGSFNFAGRAMAWFIGAIDEPPEEGDNDNIPRAPDADLDAVLENLSSEGMNAFNAQNPDRPNVPIYSVVGYSNLVGAPSFCDEALWDTPSRVDSVDPLLLASGALLSRNIFRPTRNDGIVPSASGVWGTLLGCIAADHFDEIGQVADLFPNVVSGFDHRAFYKDLVRFAQSEVGDDG